MVETLVDDQKSKTVAGIKEGFGRQVVAGANGIKALGLQQFGLADLSPVDGSGAQQTVVVVYAAPTEFGRFAIEQESFFGRKIDATNAEGYGQGICLACISVQTNSGGVAVGRLDRPQTGRRHGEHCRDNSIVDGFVGSSHHPSASIYYLHFHHTVCFCRVLIEDLC